MSLRGKRIAVLGGDRRMAEAVHDFLRAGAQVRLTGLAWDDRFAGVEVCQTGAEALTDANAAVLPVQAVTADGMLYTEGDVPSCWIDEEGLRRMAPGATLFAGLGSEYLRKIAEGAGLPLIEYREADEFAIWNSVPSAEGAIQMAMESSPFTLFGSRAAVIGYGRTGTVLAMLLKGLHSEVTVVARDNLDLARIWAAGHRQAEWRRLASVIAESDVVFNTVPASVLTREVLSGAPGHLVVIDLASAPGGTDFTAAAELKLTAILAPGLPGLVAPVTAGKIIAGLILRHLTNRLEGEGDR